MGAQMRLYPFNTPSKRMKSGGDGRHRSTLIEAKEPAYAYDVTRANEEEAKRRTSAAARAPNAETFLRVFTVIFSLKAQGVARPLARHTNERQRLVER